MSDPYKPGRYSWYCGADIHPIVFPSDEYLDCGQVGEIVFDPDYEDDVPGVLCTRCGSELTASSGDFELIEEEVCPT